MIVPAKYFKRCFFRAEAWITGAWKDGQHPKSFAKGNLNSNEISPPRFLLLMVGFQRQSFFGCPRSPYVD